jgi:hypothetical protein
VTRRLEARSEIDASTPLDPSNVIRRVLVIMGIHGAAWAFMTEHAKCDW